jgi:OmpA-OmpF porin, OOP family
MRPSILAIATATGLCAIMASGCAGQKSSEAKVDAVVTAMSVSAPAAPPPVAQVIPTPEGPLLIFFDFNSDQLSPDALKVVAQATKIFRSEKHIAVFIDGHADRTGIDRHNEWLGLQRANVVKTALVQAGVDEKLISTKSFGKSRPKTVTAEGVREPQNRRVEIRFE